MNGVRVAQRFRVLLAGTLTFLVAGCVTAVSTHRSVTSDRESPGVLAAEPVGIRIGWTEGACLSPDRTAPDADQDGVADACEHALAEAFAPELVFDEQECGWDAGGAPGRVGGGYFYGVQRAPEGGRLRIAYLPAYYVDCGWDLPVCRLTWWLCDGHAGDSEIVLVDVAFGERTERWATERIFLSAHCFGRSDGRCRWYAGRDLERFGWADGVPRGAPVVWVAHGKHAHYPSREACDAGHWGYDGCDGNTAARRFPIAAPRQNVGSREVPFATGKGTDCVGGDDLPWRSTRVDAEAVECFWDPEARFRGWQVGVGDGSTGYGRYLLEVAGF